MQQRLVCAYWCSSVDCFQRLLRLYSKGDVVLALDDALDGPVTAVVCGVRAWLSLPSSANFTFTFFVSSALPLHFVTFLFAKPHNNIAQY